LLIAIKRSRKHQYEIAFESKIQESKLSRIINGQRIPKQKEKQKIAKVLRCHINELFSCDGS